MLNSISNNNFHVTSQKKQKQTKKQNKQKMAKFVVHKHEYPILTESVVKISSNE